MMSMVQISLKQIVILLMMAVRSAEDENVATYTLLDTMVMFDTETDIMSHEHHPTKIPSEEQGENTPKVDPKWLKRAINLEGLIDGSLIGCLTTDTQAQPAGIAVALDDETDNMTAVVLNMSKIFMDMKLWNIKNEEDSVGMLYISGNAAETDFHKMLPLDDFYDAVGLAVMPGHKMLRGKRPSPRLSSLWELVQFLRLALDNVWNDKLHTDDHLALWDNIFRILVEVGSEGHEHVKSPHGHQNTCSCYRMIPHILRVCEWIKTHPKEEANMANNPAKALRAILDKVGCAEVCSTGHLCPLLFGLLPVLGITSVHIEKDLVVYDGALDSVVRAKIERLSFEGAFAGAIEQLLRTLAQTDDDGHCSWKHLKAPGWSVSSSMFVEIVTKLTQLESIEDVTVRIKCSLEGTLELSNNPRARRLLSKCIVLWKHHWSDLSRDEELREAIKGAGIEHLHFPRRIQVGFLVNHPEIWQSLKTVRWSNEFDFLTFGHVITLVRTIPSLEKIVCPTLIVKYDGTSMGTFAGKIPRKILSPRSLEINVRDDLLMPESFLELLWEILTDGLFTLTIHGKAIESLPAPKLVPAFANKFTELRIHDFGCLSTDMCSHLAEIGGGVKKLELYSMSHPKTLARRENENLAALLGSGGMMTPLGMSATYVELHRVSFRTLNLGLLSGCDKLATIKLHFSESAGRQADNDEAISRVAAAITKLGEKEKGPKVDLSLENLSADEVAKLLRQICPSPDDPARVINRFDMRFVGMSLFTDDVTRELERYLSVERMNPPTSDESFAHSMEYFTDSE